MAVPACVDLRADSEFDGAEHPYLVHGSTVYAAPLLSTALGPGKDWTAHFDELTAVYEQMTVDGAAVIAQAISVCAEATGPVLVHCGTGKDRTGVAVAVILRAAGVTRSAVYADYMATQENLAQVYERRSIFPDRADPVHRSKYDVLLPALEHALGLVEAHDGGVVGWLSQHGCDESVVDAWRRRFVDRG